MNKENLLFEQEFIPIILGASIGVYSTARSFHEAYGVISISVCRYLTGQINHSEIIVPIVESNMEDEEVLLECLNKITQTYANTPKMIIGSDEWHIEMIVNLRDKLDNSWIIPYTDKNKLQRVIDKTNFYDLCDELDVDYPKYISLENKQLLNNNLPFPFPVVVKPTSRVLYESLKFTGKMKVFTAHDREELDGIISLLRDAGYNENLVIQEYVPGDDTAMHILTLYIGQDGQTKLASFGQTLLEDHTPGGIGNPLAIRTFRNDEVIKQAEKITKYVGYVGFANFDLKYDVRDGKYKFFELNPRLGRSNYYLTAAGNNPTCYYVSEYVNHEDLKYTVAEKEALYSIVPKRLLLSYVKDKNLKSRIKELYKKRLVKNPLFYFSVEKNLKRLFYVVVSTLNYYRKFKKYPPTSGRINKSS
ncbi:carbamoyl phosphate synthase-like protein [Bacillus timonensis]|uniref:Carbamoyl phosphate synthase-like protein n=1 Tax=Bacillus timonensis TaxID=1033734 RepID=A0A4S3PIK4_9BACI|nr:carbamoyl phosphate synthase-like protein [Bacillus timonensis]THE09149.1 carbamoyl phosphate synthase-like protein [Bacillus timonensis]